MRRSIVSYTHAYACAALEHGLNVKRPECTNPLQRRLTHYWPANVKRVNTESPRIHERRARKRARARLAAKRRAAA